MLSKRLMVLLVVEYAVIALAAACEADLLD